MTDFLTELEKKVVAAIQGDMPITERPYKEMAWQVGISEASFIDTLQTLADKDIIRRFGATLRHQKSGFSANAMVAWQVAEERTEEVGQKMASFKEVTHCYQRNPIEQWPYNIYTMIHAANQEECHEIARKISAVASVDTYVLLFSEKELKKTSMTYYPFNDEDD
jgi:DNA-binding Lrp family transcriptional regulator